jgi:gluconolactonase
MTQANGRYYFNGTVYITSAGNGRTTTPVIYAINRDTKEISIVFNSYFGVSLNSSDDMAWVKKGNRTYLYFTDRPSLYLYAGGTSPKLPDTTWRFSLNDGSIVPAVSRGDVLLPNGISDGIHVDNAGRVWTAETEGVVVKNARGKVIGLFNNQAITGNATFVMEKFALALDTVVVLEKQMVWK